jgi:hypothetical protein
VLKDLQALPFSSLFLLNMLTYVSFVVAVAAQLPFGASQESPGSDQNNNAQKGGISSGGSLP